MAYLERLKKQFTQSIAIRKGYRRCVERERENSLDYNRLERLHGLAAENKADLHSQDA